MTVLSLLLIAFGVLVVIIALCTDGWFCLSYHLYSGRCTATVSGEIPFTLTCSKGCVEQYKSDGSVLTRAADRSVGHLPFYYLLFEKGKFQYILDWRANDSLFRGHYFFLKPKGAWRIGEEKELHFRPNAPWHYAIRDRAVMCRFVRQLFLGLVLLVIGCFLFVQSI